MTKLEYINQKFGSADFVKVEKEKYVKRTLTQSIFDINRRLEETIDIVKQIKSVRSVRARSFKAPMCKKKNQNLIIKIGYGEHNQIMDPLLGEQHFASKTKALTYLYKLKELLRAGELDDIVAAHMRKMIDRSEHARETRKKLQTEKKKALLQLELVTQEQQTA